MAADEASPPDCHSASAGLPGVCFLMGGRCPPYPPAQAAPHDQTDTGRQQATAACGPRPARGVHLLRVAQPWWSMTLPPFGRVCSRAKSGHEGAGPAPVALPLVAAPLPAGRRPAPARRGPRRWSRAARPLDRDTEASHTASTPHSGRRRAGRASGPGARRRRRTGRGGSWRVLSG